MRSAKIRYETVLNGNLKRHINQEITILQSFTQAYLGFQAQTDAYRAIKANEQTIHISEKKLIKKNKQNHAKCDLWE